MVDSSDIHKLVEVHEKMKLLPFVAHDPATSKVLMPLYWDPVIPNVVRMHKIPASVLKTFAGLEKMSDCLFEGKFVRQVVEGQVDEKGNAIGGKFVVVDVASVVLSDKRNSAIHWSKNISNVNKEIAESLTYIASGHSSVSLLIVD